MKVITPPAPRPRMSNDVVIEPVAPNTAMRYDRGDGTWIAFVDFDGAPVIVPPPWE